MTRKKQGFTLIELLIVIGVIAVLAAFVFVALDPMKRFQDSRNAKRWSDVNSILSAIKLDQVDNGGSYHANIAAMTDNTYYQIGSADSGCNSACANPSVTLQAACVDLLDLIDQGYIADIPFDPNWTEASPDTTGYYIYRFNSGQLLVGACHEEQGSHDTIQPIEVAR
jgi:prepilin-type N-terminal cleavage/methylation domain-containing protein